MALAAGVAGLVAFGVARLTTQSSDGYIANELSLARKELARLSSESNRTRAVLSVLASPDVSLVDLSGGALGYRGAARMYWDYETRGCYLSATEMHKPEAGEGYVLWFTDLSGKPLRGGVIEVNEKGEANLLTEMPAGIDPTAPVYVTLEKNPSAVAAPTAEPVLQDLLDPT
ncbi:MAG: anti-sigma factor [Solirubrobacteraceae bacterium]